MHCVGLLQYPLGTNGRTAILSCREYRASCGAPFSVSRRKLLDRECCVIRSVKVATPLAPLKRLSPVDLPSANGFDKPFAASKFEDKHKIILRMIVTIRRINCFTTTQLCGGSSVIRSPARHRACRHCVPSSLPCAPGSAAAHARYPQAGNAGLPSMPAPSVPFCCGYDILFHP